LKEEFSKNPIMKAIWDVANETSPKRKYFLLSGSIKKISPSIEKKKAITINRWNAVAPLFDVKRVATHIARTTDGLKT